VAFDIKEATNIFYIDVRCHIHFPETNRPALAVYIARANFGLALGNFEIGMDDGEVRYKCTITTSGGTRSERTARAILVRSLVIMDAILRT
jgi:hypothetical protein